MEPTLTTSQRYHDADRPLAALLDTLSPAQWGAPSPCEGWSAGDVVRHLIETQRDFLAKHGVDLGDSPEIDQGLAAAWRAHSSVVADRIAQDTVVTTRFDGHFGPTTVGDTLERFYVFDMVVHRWDVARAVGGDDAFTDVELDAIEAGIAGFGAALHMEGICKAGVEAPAHADRQTRVLAMLGRRS